MQVWLSATCSAAAADLERHHVGAVAEEEAQHGWQRPLEQLGEVPAWSMALQTAPDSCCVPCRVCTRCTACTWSVALARASSSSTAGSEASAWAEAMSARSSFTCSTFAQLSQPGRAGAELELQSFTSSARVSPSLTSLWL